MQQAAQWVGTEKQRHDLIKLQGEHSEYLYRRENEILDKIEQENPLTPEEWHLIWVRTTQHLQDSIDRVAQNREGD
jgi:hypothetical protein